MSEKHIFVPAEREEVLARARKVAELQAKLTALSMTNVYGMTPEKRIDIDAEVMITRDLLAKADDDYRHTLSRYVLPA